MRTQTGRRRYLRDINSRNRTLKQAAERLAMNSPIQGTAADMLKLAMVRIHKMLREQGLRTKMLLTVHDEIVFDLHRDEQETVLPLIETCMRDALPLSVPIEVELGVGDNWLEAPLTRRRRPRRAGSLSGRYSIVNVLPRSNAERRAARGAERLPGPTYRSPVPRIAPQVQVVSDGRSLC